MCTCRDDLAVFFFSSRRRHTRLVSDWSSDVCSSDLVTLFFPEANVYKGAMKRSVRELAELIDARVMGDGTVEVSRVASLQSAAVGDLIFAEEEKNFALASQSLASAVIAGEFAAGSTSSRPVLICAQPRLAFARAARLFRAAGHHEAGVHPTAIVPSSVRAGKGVNVDAYV